ncbi:cutinase family protein [Nocardia asteroides]|uniref:cutinase family protein n=1 Tax=Nocardia asteroides TaxID=1824 RepID=UPI001E294099|nr:cutinase family protein [Nocardia asteroides]UGT59882.1 cutinase family protein [Nocardia asteroides]
MSGIRLLTATVLAATASVLCAPGTGGAQPPTSGSSCPALWILGVQGTGQSSPQASETADTGMLGALLGPVVAAVPGLVQRTYIAYPAGFGGALGTGGGPVPYADSVAIGLAALEDTAARVAAACPSTALAAVGYSQGAQVVSQFARAVGAGDGPVAPEQVAGVALYADPDRAPGTAVFPGRPGQVSPDRAPGTAGSGVAAVQISTAPASGSGLAAGGSDYGALTGRVADICVEGDPSCSAPDHAALLRLAAGVAAQADLRDPLTALGSLQALLSGVLGDAWTAVVNQDFTVGPGGVDYSPQASLAARLTAAADSHTPSPPPEEVAAASARWGQITAVVAEDPVGQLPKLAGQLSGAWSQLLADNADTLNPAVWLRYSDAIARHTGYAAAGQLASGVAWLIALAHDLAGSHP